MLQQPERGSGRGAKVWTRFGGIAEGLAGALRRKLECHRPTDQAQRPPVHHRNADSTAISNVVGPVVSNIEVECAVAIDVGQGHRQAGKVTACARLGSSIDELPVPVVQKAPNAVSSN